MSQQILVEKFNEVWCFKKKKKKGDISSLDNSISDNILCASDFDQQITIANGVN